MSNVNPRTVLARRILEKGKDLVPDRFPQITDGVAFEWGEALASTFDRFPPEIWPEVVRVWAMELAGERMATPGELRDAARIVRDRWEAIPERKALLQRRREELVSRRDAILAARRAEALDAPSPKALPPRRTVEVAEVGRVDIRSYVEGLRRQK